MCYRYCLCHHDVTIYTASINLRLLYRLLWHNKNNFVFCLRMVFVRTHRHRYRSEWVHKNRKYTHHISICGIVCLAEKLKCAHFRLCRSWSLKLLLLLVFVIFVAITVNVVVAVVVLVTIIMVHFWNFGAFFIASKKACGKVYTNVKCSLNAF